MNPDLLRLDDDGSPPPEVAAAKNAMRIGVLRPKLSLVLPGGQPIPETPQDSWVSYCDWRRTKCRPWTAGADDARDLEEIDQATHEFIGELAEMGELFEQHGPMAYVGEHRAKLIDECGDAFFTGCWALDAWGHNALVEQSAPLELIVPDPETLFGQIGTIVRENPDKAFLAAGNAEMIGGHTIQQLCRALTQAGLTANAFKKLRFQRREQDRRKQAARIILAIVAVNAILILAGSTVAEALESNRKKLNARFPDGYRPGVGGGIRTGDGQ